MQADLCAFDLETTGLSPRSDRIIEVGAVRFDRSGRVLGRLELQVDPGIPVPVAIQRLTGLRGTDLAGGPSPAEAVAIFADFAAGAELVAHGAAFDVAHCAAVLPAPFAGRACLDTLELARILVPAARSHSLPRLCAELGIDHERPHRALPDAVATSALLLRLVAEGERLPASTLATIRELTAARRLALRAFFHGLVGGSGAATRPARRGPATAPRRAARANPEPPGDAGLAAAAAAALRPGGALQRATPGYEHRPAQVEMATAVAQTLERRGRLLVEAGTGTGKSAAYLTPLVLWTRRSGRRAVVATHTVTLQEQLVERDLPALAAALGVSAAAAMLKGRQHYLSLRRWERFLGGLAAAGNGADLEALRFSLKVLVWLGVTATGDRAELRLAGTEEAWWRRVMSDPGDCLGSACANWRSAECFMVAARRRADEADIVVTNHALLVADAERQGQVIAPFAALIVDEAQHLEEAATRQLGRRLRGGELASLLDPGRVPAAAGSDLEARLGRAREAVERLFGEAKGHIVTALGLEHPGNATLGLAGGALERPGWEPLRRHAAQAVSALRDAAAVLGTAGTALQAALLPQPAAALEEAALVAEELAAAAAVLERVLVAGTSEDVAWLELRAEEAEVHEAPVRVDDALAQTLFGRLEAAVLTSATLSVGGSFDFVARRTGIGAGAATLRLASPFDFLRQALTVIATDVPPYDLPEYDAALARLIGDVALRLGGRTLVLFTGYAPLRACHGLLRGRLEPRRIAVLGQGLDGTRRQVLESFIDDPRTVLLGTGALWEGIDIPGDALRCVVIAKLPFPVPTDPLVQARGALLDDAFAELLLPTAVLRLKQGFGRLIRHGDDRGAVLLCDSRVLARDYGAAFLAALPETAAARLPLGEAAAAVAGFVAGGAVPEAAGVPVAAAAATDEWEPA